jgi:hypothetical protein
MPLLDPEIDRLIREAITSALCDVHTCMLGKVQAVHGNKADIVLPIKRPVPVEDGSTTYEAHPVLPDVPIMWPGANGTSYPLDLTKGDNVWVMFSELSTAEYEDTGDTSEPGDTARHAMSSAFAIPWGRTCTPAEDFAAVAAKVQTALSNISTWLTTHTHVTPAGPDSPSALPPPVIPEVAATVTRVK